MVVPGYPRVSGTCVCPFGAPSAGNEVSEEGTVHRELQRVALLTQAAVMGEALKE